jgi:hypothetical protein
MISFFRFLLLTIIIFGCKNNSSELETLNSSEINEIEDSVLTQISDFPSINDTAQFIADIVRIYNLEIVDDPNRETKEAISIYKKVKIYGSAEDYIFIEYDYEDGSTASFPWKYQLLLTTNGKLVDKLTALRFDFLPIFPNQNPFLVTVTATRKGKW